MTLCEQIDKVIAEGNGYQEYYAGFLFMATDEGDTQGGYRWFPIFDEITGRNFAHDVMMRDIKKYGGIVRNFSFHAVDHDDYRKLKKAGMLEGKPAGDKKIVMTFKRDLLNLVTSLFKKPLVKAYSAKAAAAKSIAYKILKQFGT